MEDLVNQVLQQPKDESVYKTINVSKAIDLELDIGNLLAIDSNPLDIKEYNQDLESYVTKLARDNTQLLINKIWKLPSERVEDVFVVKLPACTTKVPREKPLPKPKPPTKWEEYASQKGLRKTKKDKLVWDETVKDWRPRYGYRRVNNIKDQWVMEVPDNIDPNTDMFGKKKAEKKERVAKNEFQRLRNIASARKLKTPRAGLVPTSNPSKDHVSKAITIAKSSTASVGKFTETLPDEKKAKNLGKKRKFESNMGDLAKEKIKSLKIFETMNNKKPKLNVTAAINNQQKQDETQTNQAKQRQVKKGGKGRKPAVQRHHKGKGKGKK